jgi:glycosyltransferase involved in cell wall biosynthesis
MDHMRILFVVQRYGSEINGGAEQHCRWLAEGLRSLNHDITVATSCASDYMTWRNNFPPGVSEVNGVKVVRFESSTERKIDEFNRISDQVFSTTPTLEAQDSWLRAQGPTIDDMREWLRQERGNFDIAIVFTYLYYSAQIAIDELSGHLPIVMHATAHDEAPFFLSRIQDYLRQVDLFLCSTAEEASLIKSTVGDSIQTRTVGIGVSLSRPKSLKAVLSKLKIPLTPFILVLGRIDVNKGVLEAVDFFREFKKNYATHLRLLLVGNNVADLTSDMTISVVNYVTESEKATLLYGTSVLIQPSRNESFSLAMHEAWLAGTPTLVNAGCRPTANQTERSGGGLTYSDQSSFITQMGRLSSSVQLRRQLGAAGRSFVLENYNPREILVRIESVLTEMLAGKLNLREG